jgi:peptide-methionine (R)-S-oxide reductase
MKSTRRAFGLFLGAAAVTTVAAKWDELFGVLGEETMNDVPPSEGVLPDGTRISLPMPDEQWREVLTPEQFQVCRKHGTERAFSGEYWDAKTPGMYKCVCCGNDLFDAATKFDSGTGWPSYYEPVSPENVGERTDRSWFMRRTEVHCNKCGAHLGHVFDDGPPPTGLRYCINSVALRLQAE